MLLDSAKFVGREEILHYINYVARQVLKIDDNQVSFKTKVRRATFSHATSMWNLENLDLVSGDIQSRQHTFLVSAVGQLSHPSIPENLSSTMSNFKGQAQFHSSNWPSEELDINNKVVACIGTGCSAAQLAPEIAPHCRELLIFQRSPGYVFPKENYKYPQFVQTLFRIFPFLLRWHRLFLFAFVETLYHAVIPSSSDRPKLSHRLFTAVFKWDMKRKAPKHLWDQLIPRKDALGMKRLVLSSNWLQMFHLPNVNLITDPVAKITAHGVVCESGTPYDGIDVLIYATGFRSGKFLYGIDVEVKETGLNLHRDVWKGDVAQAYNGVTVPNFPNFAIIYGPNTNTGHSSVPTFQEAGAEHISKLIETVVLQGKRRFEVSSKAFEEFNQREQALLQGTVWIGKGHNWYRNNDKGVIVNNYHGSTWEFWSTVPYPQFEHYEFV